MEYGCHGCHGYPLACHVGRWISVILWKPYPLVMTNIAVEHCHRNSWFTYLPSKNGDFPVRYVNVYQAGYFSEMQCCCATRGWTSPQDRHPRPLLPEGFPELENDDFHVKKNLRSWRIFHCPCLRTQDQLTRTATQEWLLDPSQHKCRRLYMPARTRSNFRRSPDGRKSLTSQDIYIYIYMNIPS